MTREISLTQGKVALVDDADYGEVARHRWYLLQGGYAVRNGPRRGGVQPKMMMHRVIMDAPKGTQVDHINHDKLDNRRANLRLCTRSQNMANGLKAKGTSSRFKGVCRNKVSGKWHAQAGHDYLGSFDSEADAARVYDKHALELYGEFALINEVPE